MAEAERAKFAHLKVPEEMLAAYPQDRDVLFHAVRERVTPHMLHVIASADYGMDYKEHKAELTRIRNGEGWDEKMEWEPNEVLSLFRWSDSCHERGLRNQTDFHVARAFCCCALLRIEDINENRNPYDAESLGPLINSCRILGESFESLLLRQQTWWLEHLEPWDEDYLFHCFGLFAVYTLLEDADPELVHKLGAWLIERNSTILSPGTPPTPTQMPPASWTSSSQPSSRVGGGNSLRRWRSNSHPPHPCRSSWAKLLKTCRLGIRSKT